jgi:hypothetical protein
VVAEPAGDLASLLSVDRFDGEALGAFLGREGEERLAAEERQGECEECRGLLVPEQTLGTVAAVEVLPGAEHGDRSGTAG